MAFPDGPHSAHVSWDTPDPIGQTIGYRIYYTSSTSSGSVAVDGVEYIVGGLANGETYTFSVSGRSRHFESEPSTAINTAVSLGKYVSVSGTCVCVCVYLCVYILFQIASILTCVLVVSVPGAPELTLVSTSRDSVSVGWELPTGTVVEEIELQWRVREIGQLSQSTTHTDSINPPTNQYTISGLGDWRTEQSKL